MFSDYKKIFWDYVHAGGHLIIQYNTNSWIGSLKDTFTPYPFVISRDRVTDEQSPVKFLDSNHAVWHYPNTITHHDFEGWVQERGIYFAQNSDPHFATPLALKDPSEDWLNGSLIIAPYGKGHITYTGLAFFRQLPAAVGGAYRIFNNLIELR